MTPNDSARGNISVFKYFDKKYHDIYFLKKNQHIDILIFCFDNPTAFL